MTSLKLDFFYNSYFTSWVRHIESDLTAYSLVLDAFVHPCTNGVSLFFRIATVVVTKQTANQIAHSAPLHRSPQEISGLMVVDDNTRWWFNILVINI